MTRRTDQAPAVDLDALPADTDADATLFIRISGPPARPPRRAAPPVAAAPEVPVRPHCPPLPPAACQLSHPSSSAPHRAPETPFRVAVLPAPTHHPPDSRLYGTILLCFGVLCVGLVAVSLAVVGSGSSRAAETHALGNVVAERSHASGSTARGLDDTGDWPDEPEDPDELVSVTAGPSGPRPILGDSAPPTPKPLARGPVTVQLPDPKGVTRVVVSCPSGFQGHSDYGASPHVIAGVPSEACTLTFRGSSPYRYHGVSGGQSLTCSFAAGVASCR
jgi:hypothetical protein